MLDPHNLAEGGHEPADVDLFIPTGRCAVCEGMNVDDRAPEDRTEDNPYVSGLEEVSTMLTPGG